jgi:hypothetical protein
MFQILQSNANILISTQHSPTNWCQKYVAAYQDVILGILTNSTHESSLESEDCLGFISFIFS